METKQTNLWRQYKPSSLVSKVTAVFRWRRIACRAEGNILTRDLRTDHEKQSPRSGVPVFVLQTFVFKFVHLYSVHHFHYTYVPAGELTFKILPYIQSLFQHFLTLILLTWRIWWAPNNASRWQIGFNSPFKGLNHFISSSEMHFKKHWLKRVVETYNRLSSILLYVSDVEHSSSGSIAAHGWSWE
jgi:hypothetical protein